MALPLALVFGAVGCGTGALGARFLAPASPREAYARALHDAGLDATALGRDWEEAGRRALANPVTLPLPAREEGVFAPTEATAVAWRMRPRRGQRLVVHVDAEADPGTRLFHELWSQPADTTRPPELVSAGEGLHATYEVNVGREGESYLLRLQPELLRAVRYTVTAIGAASLAFPVAGKDARAVASGFGAERDGGARSHEGIDIFARRGTPALAAEDGIVTFVGDDRLGGHVVTIAQPQRGHALYYAHLDRQAVHEGQRVHTGDTVGFVGNTGNARTTAPHLHFGIYRERGGAVDPLPYVDARGSSPPSAPGRDTALLGRQARTGGRTATLRAGASGAAPTVAALAPHTVLMVDAAAGGGWLRVRLPDERTGYVAAASVEPAQGAVAQLRLDSAIAVRSRPTGGAPALYTTSAATPARVLGWFGPYAWVDLGGPVHGWVMTSAGVTRPGSA